MANVFVNGLKAKTGGGKSILNNYLSLLKNSKIKHNFFVLTPNPSDYSKYASSNIEIIYIKSIFKKNIFFPILIMFVLPNLIEKLKIDYTFNLGDIVIPTKTPQLYLFDWPYAVYPESIIWKRMDLRGYVTRKIKLFFFKAYINHATIVVAQSKTMKKRLAKHYGLRNVEIVSNAVSLDNLNGGQQKNFQLPISKFKLLYLTYYYPHKNLEVLIPLATAIRKLSLPYCIVVTVEPAQHKKVVRFLKLIKAESLESIIINVGPVPMKNVPSLYSQCDALLMPTLLESFSGTYVEAMYHKKTIFTSNYDFAKDVCGSAAFYFDPLDSRSILSTISAATNDEALRADKIKEGRRRLEKLLSWEQAFAKFHALMGL